MLKDDIRKNAKARVKVRRLAAAGVALALAFGAPVAAHAAPTAPMTPTVPPGTVQPMSYVAWDWYNPECRWQYNHSRMALTGLNYAQHVYLGNKKYTSMLYSWQPTGGGSGYWIHYYTGTSWC